MGTLLLDEVGDMTPLTQSKVLRVLQEQKFQRIGGSEMIETDARVIASTNRDLEQMVAAGQFRADLYYRLSAFTVRLPPLRNRPEDMALLADYFVKRLSGRLGRDVRSVSSEAVEVLQRRSWPGNIRELQSVLMEALLSAKGPVLVPEFLAPSHPDSPAVPPAAFPATAEPGEPGAVPGELTRYIDGRMRARSTDLFQEFRSMTESHLLVHLLRRTHGNLNQAAGILGINRNTLRAKLKAYGLWRQQNGNEA